MSVISTNPSLVKAYITLHSAAAETALSPPLEELNEAVNTLATHAFTEYFTAIQLEEVEKNLRALRRRIQDNLPSSSSNSDSNGSSPRNAVEVEVLSVVTPSISESLERRFIHGATTLLKGLEATRYPLDVGLHQAFHGRAIREGIAQVMEKMKEGAAIPMNLRCFVRGYAEHVFHSVDPEANYRIYMLRPCSTIPHGVYNGLNCQFYVVTYRDPKGTTQNRLITRAESTDEEKRITWHYSTFKDGRLTFSDEESSPVTSLPDLLALQFKNHHPVGPLPEKKGGVKGYVNQYVASEESAEDAWTKDPILKALNCPLTLTRLQDPCITPDGNTYSKSNLVHHLRLNPSEPLTRALCQEHMLRPNVLLSQLLAVRMDQFQGEEKNRASGLDDWKNDPILRLFADPLDTDRLVEEPVVAPDGLTYDRKTLEPRLVATGNRMPGGWTRCTPEELILNRAAKDVLDKRKEMLSSRTNVNGNDD